jgi:subtilisin family serine protease
VRLSWIAAATLAAGALAAAVGNAASERAGDVYADALIHADAARAAGFTGDGVTVAVLDSGVDEADADLAGSVVAEHCFVPPDGCPNGSAEQDGPGSAHDEHGHGTEIAGLIVGRRFGVAPGARLVVVKVTDRNGRTSAAQIVSGLSWILEQHPEVRVVNVSLAGDVALNGACDTLTPLLAGYSSTIGALRARGTLVFAPSGNGGSRFAIAAPACIRSTVAVGAVYARSFGPFTAPLVCRDAATRADQVACFSNTSSQLDLLAPGAPLDVVALDGAQASIAGTSAASALAASVAAILLQADPALSPDELEAALETTGVPVTDPRSGAVVPRIDAAAALASVLGRPVPLLPPPTPSSSAPTTTLAAPTLPRALLSLRPFWFGRVAVSRSTRQTRTLRNTGDGYLTVHAELPRAPFSVSPSRLVVPPGGAATLRLTFRPTRKIAYRAVLQLRTDDPSARVVEIQVRGSGT